MHVAKSSKTIVVPDKQLVHVHVDLILWKKLFPGISMNLVLQ